MNILFIGDVVGHRSCLALSSLLPPIKREYGIDLTIANGENSADSNGITPFSSQLLFDNGVDVITTGNHCFKRFEMADKFEQSDRIIRPANFTDSCPGRGYCVLDLGKTSLAVVNLIGNAFMQPAENAFIYADRLLKEISAPNIIVDFHAEATSEKKAMGFYLAGKVSAVLGTHTHVQTADETVLENHTGYITDVGMTGPEDSVLGIEKDVIIKRLVGYYPQRHVYAKGRTTLNAVRLEIDSKTGACRTIDRICKTT